MRVEPAHKPLEGWHRVADTDGSTVAYTPDIVTAEAFMQAEDTRRYLLHRCRQTCAGREAYTGRLRHEPNCPAYDLGLEEEKP